MLTYAYKLLFNFFICYTVTAGPTTDSHVITEKASIASTSETAINKGKHKQRKFLNVYILFSKIKQTDCFKNPVIICLPLDF